jgi:hypothetical protein
MRAVALASGMGVEFLPDDTEELNICVRFSSVVRVLPCK